MDVALLVAKLYGAVSVALGLGMLINSKYYKKVFVDMMKDATFMFMWSIFAIIVGLLIVLNHNVWEATWVVLVTLIGWIGLVKGVVLLVFPGIVKIFEGWFKNTAFYIAAGFGSLVLGVIFLYLGFYMPI